MSVPIPNFEPNRFTSGETVQWSRSSSEFPSTSYTLTYQFRGPTQEFQTVGAVYQTSNYLMTLTAVQTALLGAGKYSIAAFVVDIATGLLRYTFRTRFPFFDVLPNPAKYVEGSSDNLTWAAKNLVAIEATLLKLNSRQVSSASVNGQSYSLQNINELLKMRNRMKEIIRSEEDAINVAAGLGAKKNILVRFPYVNTGCNSNIPGMTTPWGYG